MRHPADGEAWEDFNRRYPKFAADARNVRLGLASDGFNPFGNMSSKHSTWPVMLVPYNLPPWICMKQTSLLLSMIIPGPDSPGNDVDIYLQPLIDELLELWKGVQTCDASSRKKFPLRAALLWTINDFSALAYLYGWTTSGTYACPSCGPATKSFHLKNGKKMCYMGHRRWLPQNHIYRRQKNQFDGMVEVGLAPEIMSGTSILKMLEGRVFVLGKKDLTTKNTKGNNKGKKKGKQGDESHQKSKRKRGQKKQKDGNNGENEKKPEDWLKKQSIFFQLLYWEKNKLRHNLDVMHLEKNLCDNLIGTLMDIPSKTKDGLKARLDLVELGIRHNLHPVVDNEGKQTVPDAPFTMSREKKEVLCSVFQNLRTPDGYASNISRCVNMKDLHLMVHLVEEVRLGGPVHYRWMYPMERFFVRLKALVKNRAQPEGSIAEGYCIEECMTFCSRFLDGDTRFNRPARNPEPSGSMKDMYMFESVGEPIGKATVSHFDSQLLIQAHRYVLRHCDELEEFRKFHTLSREAARSTQNSGVVNIAEDGVNYYGRLTDIIELTYTDYKVVLFKCDWYDVHHRAGLRNDEFGLPLVNFSKKIHTGEKLEHDRCVFSSQVEQVFYVEHPKAEGWNSVVRFKPRDTFDMGDDELPPDEAN
ncbi:uncharacterized protein [Miscanthus floridulus]|uniref:uncharacterized protein n=1 Tax=Miscanthus floridulus TaxID=154761 RepID=UPI003459A9B5